MTINRHPLQARGAGQAQRLLPDRAVVEYCDKLGERFGWLRAVLREEQAAGRISAVAAQATRDFLHELRATMMVLALKHGRQLLQIEPLPLTIDPTESGMPTFKDFWALREDCANAREQLADIPSPDELLREATRAIFQGERPVKQQILWLQRSYLDRLAATSVVADFRIYPPVKLGAGGDRLHAISWTGVIRSVNLFECTTLHFLERGGWHVTGGLDMLHGLIDSAANGRHQLQEIIGLCNEAAWIVPQAIERVTIGPYHHQWTENDRFISEAFAAAPADPWILRCAIDRVATTKAGERSLGDRLFGREPMAAGPTLQSTVLLAPLAIKQHLGDADEEGNPCVVYGVSRNGDLVC
ncbi:MAG TPA: hypothetical protein VGE07_04515 [Herpetosiphonaceae bacterium]